MFNFRKLCSGAVSDITRKRINLRFCESAHGFRCFTSTETVKLIISTGAQDGHLDFHAAPELCKCTSPRRRLYSRVCLDKRAVVSDVARIIW